MKKMVTIRLFGLDHHVYAPRRDDDMIVQESDHQGGDHDQFVVADDNHDHVDTTLRLAVAGFVPRNMDHPRVYSPMPLRSFHPSMPLNSGNVVVDQGKGKSVKRRRSVDQEPEPPIPSLEEIPRLLEIIQSTNGTNPVFLYRKRLEKSDIQPHQNRLFLTRCEKLMEFLTEEERNAVNGRKEGIEVFAVDSLDKRELYKLHLVRWPSLKMIVINSDWKKIVENNRPRAGDWVEIWGYRRNGQLNFAVNFKEGAEAQSNASASSSNGGNGTSTN